jgi:hypothetical protein
MRTGPPTRRLARLHACSIVAFFLVFSAGCGRDETPHRAPPAAPSPSTLQEFGDFQVLVNAIRTDQLTPEIARRHAIERGADRVMLNVTLLRKAADGRTSPVDGTVSAAAYNLNGQLKSLRMRRIVDGTSVSFIGEIGISGDEILVFDIDATPAGQGAKFQVQFKREFFAD